MKDVIAGDVTKTVTLFARHVPTYSTFETSKCVMPFHSLFSDVVAVINAVLLLF